MRGRRVPLFVVATPIGNLADITDRAREVLASCDAVVAEDTRHSGNLLKHLGIQKPLHSLPAFDEGARVEPLVHRLVNGESLALVTDYDCWHPSHDSVTVEMVMSTLAKNAAIAQQIIAGAVEHLPYERTCECASALKYALVTRPEMVPEQVKKDLAPVSPYSRRTAA